MDTEQRLIRRLLRVDHAGEHGAVSIYGVQLKRARQHYPDLVPWLEGTLAHEVEHQAQFRGAMPSRAAKPCRALIVWSWGGKALGAMTALFGRSGIYICTAAVERTVHHHLQEQLRFLEVSDPPLAQIVASIETQEVEHLAYAESRHDPSRTFARILSAIVASATEALIFLSTRGDSIRLRQALTNNLR